MALAILTAGRLRELLHYNQETGLFTWLVNRPNGVKIGDVAGSPCTGGYIKICLLGIRYQASRIAWLHVTGKWPEFEIDHKNRKTNDNRFDNLRDITTCGNQENQQIARKDNRSGLLGVKKAKNRYEARIRVAGNLIHIGWFGTAEQAHFAYVNAKRKLHAGNML